MTAMAISHPEELTQVARRNGKVALLFFASWHEPCKQMLSLFEQLAADFTDVSVVTVDACNAPELSEKFGIKSVPTTVILHGECVIDTIEGVDVPKAMKAVSELSRMAPPVSTKKAEDVTIQEQVRNLINARPVMVFMNGTPDAPQCALSREIVAFLRNKSCRFGHFNILTNEEVRQELNGLFSELQTYPQVWVAGQLVGGLDAIKDMDKAGKLDALLKQCVAAPEQSLDERLKALISSSPIMLFMKGTPTQPQCGFSNKIVHILREQRVEFGYFNIFEDNDVREGLKKLSQWPTYPQLYVRGQLLGGLDIVNELLEAGELEDALSTQ